MYKYFKELEDRKNFKITLSDPFYDWPDNITIEDVCIPTAILEKCKNIFPNLTTINLLIKEASESTPVDSLSNNNLSVEAQCDILEHLQESSYILDRYDKSLITNAFDLKEFLSEYLFYLKRLIAIYPSKKAFLDELKRRMQEVVRDLNNIMSIELIKKNKSFEYFPPDSWYITPNGYLYNSGGDTAHKEGNMVNAYSRIRSSLNNEKIEFQVLRKGGIGSGTLLVTFALPEDDSLERIRRINEQGYVEHKDFLRYTNMMYSFPELIGLEQKVGEERSYQKNLKTLITGYIAAEACFYKAFEKVLKSKESEEALRKIEKLTAYDLDDIMVRFCRFHKISRAADRKLTTAALTGIDDFKEYLENNWTLEILPQIVYDAYQDKVEEVGLDSLFVSRYLDEKVGSYHGKGKILIKK